MEVAGRFLGEGIGVRRAIGRRGGAHAVPLARWRAHHPSLGDALSCRHPEVAAEPACTRLQDGVGLHL